MKYLMILSRLIRHILIFFSMLPDIIVLIFDLKAYWIRPYKVLLWHHGFLYLRAMSMTKGDIFLKLDTKTKCVENEYLISTFLETKNANFFKGAVFYSKYRNMDVVGFNFSPGVPLNVEKVNKEPELLILAYDIINQFNSFGFCHRDIKLDNFIYDGGVRLIDFTFCEIFDWLDTSSLFRINKPPEEIEMDLSDHKSPAEWNDYKSFLSLLDDFLTIYPKHKYILKHVYADCLEKSNDVHYTFSL
jgi:hypothetical protein